MFLLTLPMKIFGLTGTLVLGVVLYWLFIGTGMNIDRGGSCPQVTQNAKNPISGKTKVFGSICEVPLGWQKISSN